MGKGKQNSFPLLCLQTKETEMSDRPEWAWDLTEREWEQVAVCVEYEKHYPKAGLPGHSLMMVVAGLARKLNEREDSLHVEQTADTVTGTMIGMKIDRIG
jgi:hypothetical protein